jgi:hypothetical protein
MYEQDAITDDWHLWQEYLMLIRKQIKCNFENECLHK